MKDMKKVNRRKVKMHRILTGIAFVLGGFFLGAGWLGLILGFGCMIAGAFFLRNNEEAAIAAYCDKFDYTYFER